MDFRDLLNKLDTVQTEAPKDDFEPRQKPSSQELMQHVNTIQFTQPTASQSKYSIANSVKFQGKDVNDPKTKVELFKDAMQNTPGLLFSEISTRIKPTDDAQMEISQKFLDASREIDNNGKPAAEDIKLLMAVINKAVKEMSLERDADQSKYDDNADDTEESFAEARELGRVDKMVLAKLMKELDGYKSMVAGETDQDDKKMYKERLRDLESMIKNVTRGRPIDTALQDELSDMYDAVKDVKEAVDKSALEAWYNKYKKYQGNNGDELPAGMLRGYIDTGILTDGVEDNEFAKAVTMLGGDRSKAEEELFDDPEKFAKMLPITNAMQEDYKKVMGVSVIDEDNCTEAAKILGEDIVGFGVAENTKESISSALNNLDSEAVKEGDPEELDFEKDSWPLAGGDFPDYWYCDNCGKAASGGGSCPSCGAERGFGESTEVTEAPLTGMLDADVADVFGSVDKFIKNVDSSFKDGNVKVEKEPINTNNKKLPNPTKSLRVLWDKEPIKRGNGYWQAIQWADGSIHYVPMADDGTPIWTGEVPNTMRNTYKQKGFGLSTSNGGKYIQKGAVWMTREQDIDNKMKQADADSKASDQRNKVYDLQTLYVLNQMGYNSLKAAEQAHEKMSPADQEKMESEFEAGMAKAPTDMDTLKTAPSKKTDPESGDDVQAAIELLKSKGYDVSKKDVPEPKSNTEPKSNRPEIISTDIYSEGKKAKPDFLDVDNDKNKKETFKKALKDKAKKKTNESVNEEVADKKDALKHLQKLMLMPSIMKNKEMFNKIKARYDQLRSTESVEENVEETWFNDLTDVTLNGDEFYETFGWVGIDEDAIEEAEYQGRKVKLGKPMRGDVKKFKVYVKNPKGNVVKVNFGDPDMKIKKSNPARRKSFRARHNCDSPGPRHKARYWSCRKW